MNTIPESIKEAAKGLINRFGCHINHIGEYEGQQAYMACFPEGYSLGFPFIYLLSSEGLVREITGFESLRILSSINIEDVRESRIK